MMLKILSSRGFYFWFACHKVICMNSSPVPSVIPCPFPNFLVLFYLAVWNRTLKSQNFLSTAQTMQ